MGKAKIPKGLPKCELIQQLARKAGERTDTGFDFLGTLEAFRKRVAGEVRQINQLFPEYTPHDEQYHLSRLFHMGDKLLEKKRLEEMNSAELMALAVGLYGHDWGMAVSEVEKHLVLSGEPPEGVKADDLWVLPDEGDRLAAFARDERLAMTPEGAVDDMSIDSWREYVRQTHAFRSAKRVRRFFERIDCGLGDAASRICEAHWLGFEQLRQHELYPVDFAVLGETANLRALAVYVRLIDLLDLSAERTPYVIWKFVGPRDPRSRMEWDKHMAVHAVTFPEYQEGRIIRAEGSTKDHEVYAALQDLRVRCEDELRGCSNILARMNDPRHTLDLYHVDWRVAPFGFEPVSIQFEFDREQMFEILGDEVYQGDPYVFLRELLQNSIDAIRMRHEVLLRRGLGPADLGVIKVAVEHGQDGDCTVTWQDDGVGMDEHIVRDYLAVAGKSYYRSADFERENLTMDPISRFGIGILSCFMVADRVEIDTYRDPYLPPKGDPLRITIPAMRRQFRIERRPEETAEVGTIVRVFVRGKRVPVDDHGCVQPLRVTEYLSTVAAFVDFPILVTERDRKTLVVHPYQDAAAARERLGLDCGIRRLDLGYPWSDAILPQDLPTAREVFREQRWDLAADLRLDGYQGTLSYLVPRDDNTDVMELGREARILSRGARERGMSRVRPGAAWSTSQVTSGGLSRSATRSPTYTVYRDGILLPTAKPPKPWAWGFARTGGLPLPSIVVNLPKSSAPRLDLARTQPVGRYEEWYGPVIEPHRARVLETTLDGLLAVDASERLYQLGRTIAFHSVPPLYLWEAFPQDRWPVLFLEPGGCLHVLEWSDVRGRAVRSLPEPLPDWLEFELEDMSLRFWVTQVEYDGVMLQWYGERCLVDTPYRGRTAAIEAGRYASQVPVTQSYVPGAVGFVRPPWDGEPPLFQEVWVPTIGPGLRDMEAVLQKAAEDPTSLSPFERQSLRRLPFRRRLFTLPRALEFLEPFDESFAYGGEVLNTSHPVTQAIEQLSARLELAHRRGLLPADQLGRLEDALRDVVSCLPSLDFDFSRQEWSAALRRLWSLAVEAELTDVSDPDELVPKVEEFVPGSVWLSGPMASLEGAPGIRRFGQPLSQSTA